MRNVLLDMNSFSWDSEDMFSGVDRPKVSTGSHGER